jgi:hypothetical protein
MEFAHCLAAAVLLSQGVLVRVIDGSLGNVSDLPARQDGYTEQVAM